MSVLIKGLKSQHAQILKLLEDAQNLGVSSEAGRKKILDGKSLIIAHLQKEDSELYPQLSQHEETRDLGMRFSDQMKDLANIAMELFTAVESGKHDIETAKLLGSVVSNLKLRMRREESELYPAFEKLASVSVC